jgi:hypothetical protein
MSGAGSSKLSEHNSTFGARLSAGAASFWRECYRDLRRHAGDERLPYDLRVALRGVADGALRRSEKAEQRAITPKVNRLALRAARPKRLSDAGARAARALAGQLGIVASQPLVTIEVRSREELFAEAFDLITSEGYQLARIGDGAIGPISRRNVVDVTTSPLRTPDFDRWLLETSGFVICATAELQQAACASGTPSLRLDARDPFTAYPIRDGLFTLAGVVDLDTGRTLAIRDLLTEEYFRNARNYGYRPTRGREITGAVREMLHGIRHGWTDTLEQTRFRQVATTTAMVLGDRVRHLREWDAADGFLGDGRLAAIQAEHAL